MRCLMRYQIDLRGLTGEDRIRTLVEVQDKAFGFGYRWHRDKVYRFDPGSYLTLKQNGNLRFVWARDERFSLISVPEFLALDSVEALPKDAPAWLKVIYNEHPNLRSQALRDWTNYRELQERIKT